MSRGHEWRELSGRLLAALPLLLLLALLDGCGTDGGSATSLTLGGSTADRPATPPALAANSPAAAYAFVYDNQIWLHSPRQAELQQLTHLVLSRSAAISWGPLVWSPSGRYLAFALVEGLTPGVPSRSAGPLYVVDTNGAHFGAITTTPATGSIFGHTYAWLGDTMLFYSTGGGILMYDLGDANPRVWPVVTPSEGTDAGASLSGTDVAYGDLEVVGDALYYSQITLAPGASLGTSGPAGTAVLQRLFLASLVPDQLYTPATLANLFPPTDQHVPAPVRDLGTAYADNSGALVAGTWQITRDATLLVTQRIGGVRRADDTITATFTLCRLASSSDVCGAILQSAGVYPLEARPTFGFSPSGDHIALAAGALYTQATSSGARTRLVDAKGVTSPAWSRDGRLVAVTQVTSAAPAQTNIVLYDGNGHGTVLVPGGQGLAWQP